MSDFVNAGRGILLRGGHCSYGVRLFSYFFQEHGQAFRREPMVSEVGDEGQGILFKKEETIITAEGVSYI